MEKHHGTFGRARVDESHVDSNTAMARATTGAARCQLDRLRRRSSTDVELELDRVKHEVSDLGTFDVVILGMGNDFTPHRSSLLYRARRGINNRRGCTDDATNNRAHRRLSLSKARLLDTKMGVVHIVGSKLEVFDIATKYADDDVHPISHFYHHAPFSLWFSE